MKVSVLALALTLSFSAFAENTVENCIVTTSVNSVHVAIEAKVSEENGELVSQLSREVVGFKREAKFSAYAVSETLNTQKLTSNPYTTSLSNGERIIGDLMDAQKYKRTKLKLDVSSAKKLSILYIGRNSYEKSNAIVRVYNENESLIGKFLFSGTGVDGISTFDSCQ